MQIKKYFFAFLSLSIIFSLLSGCAHRNKQLAKIDKKDLHDVTVQLRESADSVNKSLYELARIERATHPAAKLPNPLPSSITGMPQKVSLDWTGPVGPLVDKIAKMSSYKVRVLGNPPAMPIVVSVTAKSIPLSDLLRDANYQCGERANIALYPADKVIELRYAKK